MTENRSIEMLTNELAASAKANQKAQQVIEQVRRDYAALQESADSSLRKRERQIADLRGELASKENLVGSLRQEIELLQHQLREAKALKAG